MVPAALGPDLHHLGALLVASAVLATAFVACVVFVEHLALLHEGALHEAPPPPLFSHEILGRVLLAFMLTAFAALSVFAVDKTSDAMRNKYSHDKDTQKFLQEITRVIVNSLGILVGFSWEHSFDGSVEDVAATTSTPLPAPEFQLGLGMSVCILILPAWRDYILEKVMLIDVMLKQKRALGKSDEPSDDH